MDNQQLAQEIEGALGSVRLMKTEALRRAEEQLTAHGFEEELPERAYHMRNSDGSYTMAPFLLAESNLLLALSNLKE